jgi:hypothetical protein
MKRLNIKIYDNGEESFDRYTIVFLCEPERQPGFYAAFGMSENPFHPQGFGQWCTAQDGAHLGKRINAEDLPLDCRNILKQITADYFPIAA